MKILKWLFPPKDTYTAKVLCKGCTYDITVRGFSGYVEIPKGTSKGEFESEHLEKTCPVCGTKGLFIC